MTGSKTKNPHSRTRSDHASETAEDYVEAINTILCNQLICRASDLAKRFAVSHVTVHRIVGRLQEEGLLVTQPYQPIQLTSAGRRLAKRAKQRHDIVYNFLLAIGVSSEVAAIDAEGIEHHVSPLTLKQLEATTKRIKEKHE